MFELILNRSSGGIFIPVCNCNGYIEHQVDFLPSRNELCLIKKITYPVVQQIYETSLLISNQIHSVCSLNDRLEKSSKRVPHTSFPSEGTLRMEHCFMKDDVSITLYVDFENLNEQQ